MNKKTILTICLSVVLIAIVVVIAILVSPKTSDVESGTTTNESSVTETLPVTSEGETSAEATTKSGETTTADISATASNTDYTVNGSVATGEADNTEEVSLEVYVPTDITYESTRADGSMSYLAYLALDAKGKEAHYDSFTNPADFYTWFNAAYDEYMAELNPTQIGPTGNESN